MQKVWMKKALVLFLLFPTLLFGNNLWAQNSGSTTSIFDLMHYKEVLSVTLEADFSELDTTRRNPKGRKAQLVFEDQSGQQQRWAVKLTPRGNFRRLRCEMSPLKINFKKKELKAAGLANFDDMKLVTHCVSGKLEAKNLLAKEYLGYRLYNELSDFSYRVQLLRITYKDTATGKKTKRWAVLIEDTAQLKDRINASQTVKDAINLPRDTFHQGLLKIASVFEYLIGNSDWNIKTGRNVKFVRREDKIIPIPYDFDFSGLVNAGYAIPNPNYGIPSVKTRIFLGFEEDLQELNGTLAYFKKKRLDLLTMVDKFTILSTEDRMQIIRYLDSFYQTLDEIVLGETKRIVLD